MREGGAKAKENMDGVGGGGGGVGGRIYACCK